MSTPRYERDGFSLFEGDCLEVLRGFGEDHFDMVFADPPYHLSNDGFTCHAGKRVSVNKGEWDTSSGIEADFEFHKAWISECRRVLKPEGSIWISGTYHSIYACGFALQLLGFKLLNDIAWFKPNAAPNISCRYFTASHETLLWAIKDPEARHTFNYDDMRGGDWHEGDALKKPERQMRTVWSICSPKDCEKSNGKHPTQKPLELLRRVILASTTEGDLVLDPFCGSATTGIAAALNGRRFVGIDSESDYIDLSMRRFEQLLSSPDGEAGEI
ncbi:MAG: site-specific DNA-methyltransferase [Candidatus Coatesbacteria bacterium]|nr:site-specific DNA-methyltransferase [Candidatus Coatesbacteria bacterium]